MNRIPNKIIQFSLALLFSLIPSASLYAQERCTTEVFAGTGVGGYSVAQDGGPATAARLNNPLGVAVDSLGRVFIADSSNYRIRMVVPETGIISTVAGRGPVAGGLGIGGPATGAFIYNPYRVAVDSLDRVYISVSHRIWRFVPGGTIDSIVGTGDEGFYGDGGAATLSRLRNPSGIAFDASDNLYLADRNNHRIRIVTSSGSGLIIDTLAGSGDSTPAGVTPADGPAENITFRFPRGVAVDNGGNILIADTDADIIWRVYRSGPRVGEIERIAGHNGVFFGGDNGPAIDANMFGPADLDVDGAGNIYIADTVNDRIRRIRPDGTISTIVGPENDTDLGRPEDIALTSDGLFYIADTLNHRILRGRCTEMTLLRGGRVFISGPAGGSAGSGDGGDDGGVGPGGVGPGGGGVDDGGTDEAGDAGEGGGTDLTLGTAVGGDGLPGITTAGGSGSDATGATDASTVSTTGGRTSFFQGDPEQNGAVAQFRGGSGSEASGSVDGTGEGVGEGEGPGTGSGQGTSTSSGQGAGGGTTGTGTCSLMR